MMSEGESCLMVWKGCNSAMRKGQRLKCEEKERTSISVTRTFLSLLLKGTVNKFELGNLDHRAFFGLYLTQKAFTETNTES